MKDDQIEKVAINEAFHKEVRLLDKQLSDAKSELSQTMLQMEDLKKKRRMAVEKLMTSQDNYLRRVKDLAMIHNLDIVNARWNFDCGSMAFTKSTEPTK